MKIITNPLRVEIEVQFNGKVFNLPAESEARVSEDLAIFWKGIHPFLIVSEVEPLAKKVIEQATKPTPTDPKEPEKPVVKPNRESSKSADSEKK